MTLEEWRKEKKLNWVKVEKLLHDTGNGTIYINRIQKLRGGSVATSAEIKALLEMTNNEVDDYRD